MGFESFREFGKLPGKGVRKSRRHIVEAIGVVVKCLDEAAGSRFDDRNKRVGL